MSINQLKKAVSALKSYLNRDKQGQELLDKVVREVHDLRIEATTGAQRADTAERRNVELREQVTKLSNENEAMRREQQSLRGQLQQSNAIADTLQAKLDRVEERFAVGSHKHLASLSSDGFHSMLEAVITAMGGSLQEPIRFETVTAGHAKRAYFATYQVHEVLRSWDNYGFATLGKMWVLASVILPFHVVLDSGFTKPELEKSWGKEDYDAGFKRAWQFWYHAFEKWPPLEKHRKRLDGVAML